jgi:hypothetical protein
VAHLHRQIVEAVASTLTGLPTSGPRVYTNRLHPMQDAHLPGLRIFLGSETAEPITVSAETILERDLSIIVEACAKAISDVDQVLDAMSLEVESALADGVAVSGKRVPTLYSGMEMELDGEMEKPVGVKRMTFRCLFRAAAMTPDTLI